MASTIGDPDNIHRLGNSFIPTIHGMVGSYTRVAGATRNSLFGVVNYFDESPLHHILRKKRAPYYLQLLHDNGVVDSSIGYHTPCQVGGYKGGSCGGINDCRVLAAQAELTTLLNAEDRNELAIAAVEKNVEEAENKRKYTSDGKRDGGLCGGMKDHWVLKAQDKLYVLLDAEEQDKDAIAAAEKNVEKAEIECKATSDKKSANAKKRIKDGTHPLLDKKNIENTRKREKDKYDAGKGNLQNLSPNKMDKKNINKRLALLKNALA
jgi:hypothetical protein